MIPEILEKIKIHSEHLDEHHEMLFYYKIASIYFGNEKYNECIFYLDKIINNKNLNHARRFNVFCQIFVLIAHYELGKDYYLENHLKTPISF